MKKVFQPFILGLVLITACTTKSQSEYPVEVTQNFMNSCVRKGATQEACACMLEKIQAKYTFEEFSTIETNANAGKTSPDFNEFANKAKLDCAK